ncbi:TetR/AcrR family transcriptional regulator [Desulforamulus aquiferis]|nr:TetR/AcrR family transcriptional regulator [Desulforamulus aquiferis]
MNGYEKRKEMKKAAIVNATQELIFKNGVAETSIDAIARKAQVSKVTIFKHFSSKENLVLSVFTSYMNKLMDEFEKLIASNLSAKEKISKVLIASDNGSDAIGSHFFNSIIWDDPMIQFEYSKIASERALPAIVSIFMQGKAEGVIDEDITTEALIAYIGALMAIFKDPNFLKSSQEYKNSIRKLYFYGIFGKKG